MRRLIWTGLLLLVVASCVTADELLFHEQDDGHLPEHSHIQARRSTSETDPGIDINNLKLKNGLAPTNYRIRIQPFLQRGYFQGQMNISLLCVNATKIITLLTNNSIQIHETRVRSQNSAPQELQYDLISSGVGNPYQLSYGITLTENMVQGATYEMEVSFVGALSTNNSEGFFVNSIVDQKTQERRWFAAINDALHVFPSLNETVVKAMYDLSIVRPDNMKAISNMPIENTYTISNETHLSEDHFRRTPPMDMSSVAVVLIDNTFEEILNVDSKNEGPLISVHGRRHLESSLRDAATAVRQYVEYFHKYFGVAYPLPKLDIVALPQALATPVNLWGVIILQEDVSLNELNLQFQLTHDIIQQWMTHLATPVSRSSGVYVALKMIIAFVRNEKMPQINNSSTTINYLDYDSVAIHSLYYEFGRRYPYARTLSMKKAGRIEKAYSALRMLNFTVTERTFQGGVQKFIQDRQYKMYDEDDLFSKWTEQAREDGTLPEPYSVKTIMWAWLIHDRYPVVTITRNYDDSTARLEQHMLLRDRPHDVPNAEKMLWWIPIQYLTPSNLNVGNLQTVTWFEGEREMTLGNLPDAESFIIVNPDEIGMFMVNYDLRNWNMISEYMQNAGQSTMGMKTRVKLLHDAWNLAFAGELDFGAALNMTLFLHSETEYAVWDTFLTMVDHVGRHISGTYAGRKFSAYVCQVVAPLYESLQAIETDSGNIPHARLVSDAKHTLCYEGYRPGVDDIRAAYNQWMHNPHENSHVIGRADLCSTLKWSTSAEWEFALSRALNTTEPHHQSLRRTLAGCTMNEKRMERLLNVTFLENSTLFTDEELRHMLNQMTNSAYGYTALFHFVCKNWDAVKHRCDNNPSLWSYIIETAVTNFKTQQGLDLVSQLLDTKRNQMGITARHMLYKGIRKATAEAEWSKNNLPVIEKWLDEHLNTTDNILSLDEEAITGEVKDYELPDDVLPTSYRLHLQPFFEEGHFVGVVHINVTCQNETDTIKLHVHNSLRVSHAAVRRILPPDSSTNKRRERVIVAGTKKNPSKQWYEIVLAQNLTPGASYEVELSFSGSFMQNIRKAFYLHTYEDKNSTEKRWFAGTWMEDGNARRVFPCFDNPKYKTTFELSIVHPSTMTAIFTMPIQRTENLDDYPDSVVDYFEKSPLTSLSSVAIVLSALSELSPVHTRENDIPRIRVYGQESTLSELQNVHNMTTQVISFLQDYFNETFPLPVINIIALPESADYNTDNYWGIIIYSESSLTEKTAFLQLSNEIAKQWLWHLSTPFPKNNDEHISNALALFIARSWYKVIQCHKCYIPTYWDYSLYYECAKEHPLADLERTQERINLRKTRWILNMLNYTLTENTFKKAVRSLLENRKYNLYAEEDVFEALTQQAHEDGTLAAHISVDRIVKQWMKNYRFPVVTVTRNYGSNTANIEQHMLLRYVPKNAPNVDSMLWWVPIQYLTKQNLDVNNLQTITWMEEQKQISIDNLPNAESFIILNPDEIGMFMVNYDHTNWHLLSEYLQESSRNNELPQIDPLTRKKLLHDAWNLAYAGELNFGTALDMTLFLRYEQDQSLWDTFYTMLDHVGRRISATTAGNKLAAYTCQFVVPLYNSLKEMEDKDETQQYLQSYLYMILCNSGYRPCIDEVRSKYRTLMSSPDEASGASLSRCVVFTWGDLEEWQFALHKLLSYPQSRNAEEDEERFRLLQTLAGCPRDEHRIERILNITVLENNGTFNENDQRLVFNMLTGSTHGITGLFKFVEKNWDAVKQRCADKPGLWHYLSLRAFMNFKTQEGLDLLTRLYNARKGHLGSATPLIEEALNFTRARAEWSNENLPVIEQWVDAHLDMNGELNGTDTDILYLMVTNK